VSIVIAEVTRGDIVESRHHGVVAVADATGRVIASAGDPERLAYLRSSAKPFQAIPLVESGAADAFGFTDQEVAMACASHDATPRHQRVVERMLAKAGLDEDALRCGVTPPMDEQEQARIALGLKPTSQIQCECSGEHAGMVAACKHLGYPLESYNAPDHPLQQWLRQIVAEVTRVPEGGSSWARTGAASRPSGCRSARSPSPTPPWPIRGGCRTGRGGGTPVP
jgi:L-asparaginase II